MSKNPLFLLASTGLLAGALWASPQDQNPNAELDKQLRTMFVPTKLAADRVKVVQAGTVLSVQKEGIGAISPTTGMGRLSGSDQAFYPNVYKSGTVKHDALKGMFLEKVGSVRDLAIDEKVYLLKIDYKGTAVIISVQTCGTCDPKLVDPENIPARAAVSIQFPKGYLETATPDKVQTVISHVFAPAPAADAGPATQQNSAGPQAAPQPPPQQQAAPAPPPQPLPDIPPPPPPSDTPAPPPVETGQTPEQVIASMGQPQKRLKVGTKEIFVYQGMKITFVGGKVTSID